MNYIFIDCKDGLTKTGIVENNRLVEYYSEEKQERLVGNIYRARVMNVLKGMAAAFVDIGEGKNAYLYIKDALTLEQLHSKDRLGINDVVKAGQELIVQVTKEELGSKGPKVTTRYSIPGRYLVLTPNSKRVSTSKKITDNKEVQRLKEIGRRFVVEDNGLIFRTISEGVHEDLLREEYNNQLAIYKRIEKQRDFLPTPKLLYRELDLATQVVRDSFNHNNYRIVVNNKDIYKKLLDLEDYFSFTFDGRLTLDTNFSIDKDHKLQQSISEAFKRSIPLKNGGYIVIDEAEALTAIDINTGKYIGSYSLEDTVLQTNLEAAEEIARQIRLRDIGGIIIIDFIDMRNRKNISLVLKALSKHLNNDRNKANIIGITKLGLVELTRKKIRPTIDSLISTKCPLCEGRGRIQNKY